MMRCKFVHESHESRIRRNEIDIQDGWKKFEALDSRLDKMQMDIAKIVGGLTVIGVIANSIIDYIK